MPLRYYANAPATTTTVSCSAVATTLSVASTAGLPIAYPYTLILDRGTATEEAVSVTGGAGLNLTVTRGIDSTTAFAHDAGASVVHGITAQDVREPNSHINANVNVHGVAGAVVGTTDTQALQNKTFDATSPTAFIPPGVSWEYWGTTAPAGWLMEDGSEQPIATYTALYNLLTANGTVFPHGANTNGSGGAGSTHFRLPNSKGKVPVGRDSAQTEFDTLGETGGAKTHTLTTAEMPSHNHTASTGPAGSHKHVASFSTTPYTGGVGELAIPFTGAPITHPFHGDSHEANSTDHTHTVTVNNNGSGGAHNNLQPYIVKNFIIKT